MVKEFLIRYCKLGYSVEDRQLLEQLVLTIRFFFLEVFFEDYSF